MKQEALKTRFLKTCWRIILIFIGSAITGSGISLFLEPHKLLSGGVTGTSMLLSYFTDFNPGYWVIIFNLPLFIVAWRKIDLNFCIYSVIGTLTLSAAMIILGRVENMSLVSDPLLASIFGGILCGGGTGLVLRARASQGGTDIISVVIRQRFSISIGMVSFYINIFIVAILSIKFGIELGLLTIFAQYISAQALDRVVTGLNTAKGITIISDHAEEIADYIMKKMYRGVTFLEGEGAFAGRHKKIIWCVVTTSQLTRIKGAMKKIDPEAFMAISDASEIIGKGFHRIPF